VSLIRIRTRNAEYTAELDDSDISNTIWLSLPFKAQTNMLGNQIYFEMPLDANIKGETSNIFDVGDIAYWPKVNAVCIFFGPTPFSGEDGRPVSKFPLIKIGKVLGDCSEMEDAGDRQRITLEQSF